MGLIDLTDCIHNGKISAFLFYRKHLYERALARCFSKPLGPLLLMMDSLNRKQLEIKQENLSHQDKIAHVPPINLSTRVTLMLPFSWLECSVEVRPPLFIDNDVRPSSGVIYLILSKLWLRYDFVHLISSGYILGLPNLKLAYKHTTNKP